MVKFAMSFSLMQKVAKHIIGFLMALVILFASLQVSVSKMTCYIANDTFYSLGEFEDCKPKSDCELSNKCCDFDKITFDYNVSSTVNFQDINLSKMALLVVNELPLAIKTPVIQPTFLTFFHKMPLPLSGYDLLKVIQVFRL